MKILICLASLCLVSTMSAGEVNPRISAKEVGVNADYDQLNRSNVILKCQAIKGSASQDRKESIYNVAISGNTGLCVVEMWCERPWRGKLNKTLVGQGTTEFPKDSFNFIVSSGHSAKGWFVRVIRDGQIVGYAGSAPSYEQMAKSAATILDYKAKY